MAVSVETSGEVGERASVTISCDYSDALIASNSGHANEDCAEQGWGSRGGLAGGKNRCMDLQDRA